MYECFMCGWIGDDPTWDEYLEVYECPECGSSVEPTDYCDEEEE